MRRLSKPPTYLDLDNRSPQVETWFVDATNRMHVYSGANNPAVSEVPENQWIVYRNTTLGEVRIWTNIAGVLKKSAAFT